MVHPDHQTRIGAHQIFSVVLVPSSVCPHSDSDVSDSKKNVDLPRSLSRTVSVFSSSAALFEKLKRQHNPSKENDIDLNNGNGVMNRIKSTYSRVYSFKSSPPPDADNASNRRSKEVVGLLAILLHFRFLLILLIVLVLCMVV